MGIASRLRALGTEPPIRDRVVWRGILRPAARDPDDRAVVASAFGALYTLGGLIGLAAVAFDNVVVVDDDQMAIAGAAAIAIGIVCLVGYQRLPRGFFHLAATAGIGIVSLAAIASEHGAEAIYAPFYAFIVMLCMLLFRPLPALLQGVLALIAYGTLLYARDAPFATHLLLSSFGMLLSLGVLVAVMRTRANRIAGELSFDAYIDQLTRVPNRRSFDERFALEIERARRQGSAISLVICDLDHFKEVNDDLGHHAGDAVLQRAARAIDATTRSIDLVARIGGEEFGLILPDADPEQAATAAERVRHGIREEFERMGPRLTASCGISSAAGETADRRALFAAADRALYAAKRSGRDCTAIASGEEIRIVGGGSAIARLRKSLTLGPD